MDYHALISEAQENVSAASYSPKKLTAIHAGVLAGVGLLVAVLSYLLNIGIGEAGGLGGIGTRAALETVQSVLQMASLALTPFWAMGFTRAALLYADRQSPNPQTLMSGFYCWGPVLRLLTLRALLYFAVTMLTLQVGSMLFALSPTADRIADMVMQAGALDADAIIALFETMDTASLFRLTLSILPYFLIPTGIALIYLSYRLRFADFLLMAAPQMGAMAAIAQSFRLTKGHILTIFKMDLRFWWFYVLEVLVTVLSYGDVVMTAFGTNWGSLDWLASLLFYAVALVVQIGLYVWRKPQVVTSYAVLFKYLLPQPEDAAVQ